MNVRDVMTFDPRVCWSHDTMTRAAQIMWQSDCGCVPVVDYAGRPIGMITDRDICMAAYTRGQSLSDMTIASLPSGTVVSVRAEDSVAEAERLMRVHRVRRLPVVDEAGILVGILSMNDLALHGRDDSPRAELNAESIVETLAAVSGPRP